MINAVKQVLAYRNIVNPQAAYTRTRAHSNRTLGHRSPDSPTGYLIQDNGVFQAFSGVNKLILSLNSGAFLSGSTIGLGANSINLVTPGLQTLSFNGLNFRPEVPAEKYLVLLRPMADLYLVDGNGRQIPLAEVVEEKSILVPTQNIDSASAGFFKDLIGSLDLPIPNWLQGI